MGDVAIHKLALQGAFEPGGKQLFGNYPAYVAFRNDAVFLALGEDGLAALKEAVAAKPQKAAALVLDFSAARFAVAMEQNEAAVAAARKLLSAGDDARMRLTLEGGSELRVRLTMSLSALKVFAPAAK